MGIRAAGATHRGSEAPLVTDVFGKVALVSFLALKYTRQHFVLFYCHALRLPSHISWNEISRREAPWREGMANHFLDQLSKYRVT